MSKDVQIHNLTKDTIADVFKLVFAPWVQEMNPEWLEVERGRVLARIKRQPKLCHYSPARPEFANASSMCGQALMCMVDTVFSMAIFSGDALSRGTISINTNFVTAANTEAVLVEAKVQRFGKSVAIGETRITDEATGRLMVHATCTFALNAPEKVA
jgi:acyl-coenzyme A thioesterase PaaI-like protein